MAKKKIEEVTKEATETSSVTNEATPEVEVVAEEVKEASEDVETTDSDEVAGEADSESSEETPDLIVEEDGQMALFDANEYTETTEYHIGDEVIVKGRLFGNHSLEAPMGFVEGYKTTILDVYGDNIKIDKGWLKSSNIQ